MLCCLRRNANAPPAHKKCRTSLPILGIVTPAPIWGEVDLFDIQEGDYWGADCGLGDERVPE